MITENESSIIIVIPSSKSQVTVYPPFAPLSKGRSFSEDWGDRNVAQIVQNGIIPIIFRSVTVSIATKEQDARKLITENESSIIIVIPIIFRSATVSIATREQDAPTLSLMVFFGMTISSILIEISLAIIN